MNDGRARGVGKGPRRKAGDKQAAGRMGGLAAQARRRKKAQPKAKFLSEMPKGAVKIKGVHKDYSFVPGLGVLSLVKEGRIRLLTLPRQTGSWTVRDTKGDRYFLTRNRLRETGVEVAV